MISPTLKIYPVQGISKLLMNSLYGRFGMSPITIDHTIIDPEYMNISSQDEYIDFWVNNIGSDIAIHSNLEIIGKSVEHNSKLKYKYNQDYPLDRLDRLRVSSNTNALALLKINTPIAIFTTAYARMYMAEYKIKYANNLYYSDTDSLVLDRPLSEELVGSRLGQFKLEYKAKEGIFLAPKVYILLLDINETLIKIKGNKGSMNYDDFNKLLNLNNKHIINHNKWFKDTINNSINIIDMPYTVSITNDPVRRKRISLYKDKIAYNITAISVGSIQQQL